MADTNPTPASKESITETEIVQPQSRRRGILIVVVVVVALIAAGLWWRSTYSEDTDDAQVNGHLIQVSSRIGGQVLFCATVSAEGDWRQSNGVQSSKAPAMVSSDAIIKTTRIVCILIWTLLQARLFPGERRAARLIWNELSE